MLLKSDIENAVTQQASTLDKKKRGLTRDSLDKTKLSEAFATIVSGVRRCGKSTMLYQLLDLKFNDALYLNFENPMLFGFEINDFSRLDELIAEQGKQVLFFDEIQVVTGWERYVRMKLEDGFRIIITGSNASLLSRELGTSLTGRHISKVMFPFSFNEFCLFEKCEKSGDAANDYLERGGFPEYLVENDSERLGQLLDDILLRDIAVRYGVRDIKSLKRMALYLLSNVGKPITGNKLRKQFELGSTNTVMEYLSHFEDAYLLFFLQKFSYSAKKQMINPRKVYAIDTGLIHANTLSFSKDKGRMLENAVFLHYKRLTYDLYYFQEKGECDFVLFEKEQFAGAVQVCYDLNSDNLNRELKGLHEAMDFFGTKEGTIVTLKQKDRIEQEGKVVNLIPFHEL